jgi:hypothetical protein
MFNGINEGGLNNILSQRLGVKGSSAAPAVAPEVFPCLTLENDRPEWSWLKGESLRGIQRFTAAVAGQNNALQLYIPTNVNAVAVVTRIQIHNAVQHLITRAPINGTVTGWTTVNSIPRDFRNPTTGEAVRCEAVSTASAFVGATIANSSSNVVPFNQPIVLAPKLGVALIIRTAVVNTALDVDVQWYERSALPGELV